MTKRLPGYINVRQGLDLYIFCVAQVETVAQFGVIFLLFALGLEFSAAKVCMFPSSYIFLYSSFGTLETVILLCCRSFV